MYLKDNSYASSTRYSLTLINLNWPDINLNSSSIEIIWCYQNYTIMKNLMLVLIFSLFGFNSAQSQQFGEIAYVETVKMTFDIEEMEGIDLSGMLPDKQSFDKVLTFSGKKSLYCDAEDGRENEDTEFTSDDGSFQIVLSTDDSEQILHTDLEKKKIIHQQGFMGKSFVVTSEVSAPKWKIGADRIKYLGYECVKATQENDQGEEVVVWYTPEIPVSVGPDYFSQLPGAILMVSINNGDLEIKATAVKLEGVDTSIIKAPKDGKKVTQEEFLKIQEEKIKEMEEMNDGDNIIISRG